jgi:hypothetical protein
MRIRRRANAQSPIMLPDFADHQHGRLLTIGVGSYAEKAQRLSSRLDQAGVAGASSFRHNWNPSVAIAFSIVVREILCGGALSGPMMPVTVQGPWRSGSLLVSGPPAKAWRFFRVSDLKM